MHTYLRTKKIVYTPFVIHLWVINREFPLQLDLVWGHEEEKNKEYFHASTPYWTIHHHTTWWDDWRFRVQTNRIWYRSMNIKCYEKLHGNRTHETSCYSNLVSIWVVARQTRTADDKSLPVISTTFSRSPLSVYLEAECTILQKAPRVVSDSSSPIAC